MSSRAGSTGRSRPSTQERAEYTPTMMMQSVIQEVTRSQPTGGPNPQA
jgi:hypothetical protein